MENEERLIYAGQALDGIALGDCFGQTFFVNEEIALERIKEKKILHEAWHFTDDTVMSIGVYNILRQYGEINQDKLAALFAKNYLLDWHRGYGSTAHSILRGIGESTDWRIAASNAFDGMGSMGNGAAMRAAPIGAYFADNLEKVTEQAAASAQVTHSHIEGIAGAIAVAQAAALMLNKRKGSYLGEGKDFICDIACRLPECDTKYKILSAVSIKKESKIEFVISTLGNGMKLTAQDTVPFCIWCAAYYYQSLQEALWKAVSALGDRDTICAIVGGIVSLYDTSVPQNWRNYMENPKTSEFYNNME